MVVFTCNNCGESLQKPKVEKHYFTVCRKAPKSLTCVDCFKDFKEEEYTTHTKCVTEEERYAAKGSFPQGVVKKGDVKQESWTEIIKSVIDSATNVKPSQKQIFTIMTNSANVPRKKNKFVNFIKSASGNKASNKDIEEVWDTIEKYKESQQQQDQTKESGGVQDKNEKKLEDAENQEEEQPKKKKKKSKNTADAEKETLKAQDESKTAEEKIEENGAVLKDKKKKKKNSATTDEQPKVEDCQETAESIANTETAEKKKKKNKLRDLDNSGKENSEQINPEQTQTTADDNVIDGSKKKKRKSKDVKGKPEEITENEVEGSEKKKRKTDKVQNGHLENGKDETNTKESKKRKLKDSNLENEAPIEKKMKQENGEQEDETKSCGFCFKEKILEVMKTKKNTTLEKLEKKVLNLYHSLLGIEPSEKVAKKMRKHLKKIDSIEVNDNIVKLKED